MADGIGGDGNSGNHHRRTKSTLSMSLRSGNSSKDSHSKRSKHQSMAAPPTSNPRDSIALNSRDGQDGGGSSSDKRGASLGPAGSQSASGSGSGSNVSLGSGSGASLPLTVPPPTDPKATVEQTVLTFKLFESLRSGDTAQITKILHSPTPPDNILHLAVQCASPQVLEFILSTTTSVPPNPTADPQAKPSTVPYLDINSRDHTTGNTPLHLAAQLGRTEMVSILLSQPAINDTLPNYSNKLPLDLSRTPQIHEKLQIARSVFLEEATDQLLQHIDLRNYEAIEALLDNERVRGVLDVNAVEVSVTPAPGEKASNRLSLHGHSHRAGSSHSNTTNNDETSGSTLLHEAARKKDTRLIQILLYHGADPFRRDKRGKLPQDVTKDETTRGMLKRSPARVAAERGLEQKFVLGNSNALLYQPPAAAQGRPTSGVSAASSMPVNHSKESREMKGHLKKWTNYTGGWKLRWFVLEDGVMSYYKSQDDVASACRGAINMRIAQLHMDPQDKTKFDIVGKASVKYHLKAGHEVEAKRWYWTLNNAIQWSKDEARSEQLRKQTEAERYTRVKEATKSSLVGDAEPSSASHKGKSTTTLNTAQSEAGGNDSDYLEVTRSGHLAPVPAEDDSSETSSSSSPSAPPPPDALLLSTQSLHVQLDLLSQLSLALALQAQNTPEMPISDPSIAAITESYETSLLSLKQLIGDVVKIARDRDSYWKKLLEKERGLRTVWEENMKHLVVEQERLEGEMATARERRRKERRKLKEVLGQSQVLSQSGQTPREEKNAELKREEAPVSGGPVGQERPGVVSPSQRKKSFLEESKYELSDDSDDSDAEDEFFDAIESGEVEVVQELPRSPGPVVTEVPHQTPEVKINQVVEDEKKEEEESFEDVEEVKREEEQGIVAEIKKSFIGYEDPPRTRLSKDTDDRPKISLWGILKSMIGKDMTKMTLPVSFNECTSLLQRVCEDMEYTNLLDIAATHTDPSLRLVYIAAFAASEYASTLNRVAKPFNPLLGETYEYCSPANNFRFFIEQVSHHPPIGAAYAESPLWTYYGESAVKSKFYGKSMDINPLGTWFLRLTSPNPSGTGPPVTELYTWKKVNTSVIGIITGTPSIDNYGPMLITNHSTNHTAHLDFKPRGWRISSAYEVKGRVLDPSGAQTWSIGGRWNDKIYARQTPSDEVLTASTPSALLVWEVHPRPPAPFNLTTFAIGLNALPDNLKPRLCPTDTRLRPDQRAMEDGEYDFAADEKHRLEEKQRARRREREENGESWSPRWFEKAVDETTGEEYWRYKGEYWKAREAGEWKGVEDIF